MSIMVVFFIIYYVKASQRDRIQDEEFRSDKATAELHKQIALQHGWLLEDIQSYETHDFFTLEKVVPAGIFEYEIDEEPDAIDDITMWLYINFRETSFVASHVVLETPIKLNLTSDFSAETLKYTEEKVISEVRIAAKNLP
jgi:hypothetical protein